MNIEQEVMIDPDVATMLRIVSMRTFTPFTDVDWWGWGGCQSNSPMISYGHLEEDPIIIIDGDVIILYDPLEQVEHRFTTKYKDMVNSR